MKKKILIVTAKLDPYIDANGGIATKLKNEFKSSGFEVYLIGVGDDNHKSNKNEFYVSRSRYSSKISNKNYSKWKFISKFSRKIYQILTIFSYPNYDRNQNKKILKKIIEVDKKIKFDYIISICKPYSNIEASLKFKKNNKDIKLIFHFLDLIDEKQSRLVDLIIRRKYYKIFSKSDFSFLPSESIEYFRKMIPTKLFDKIDFVELPSFSLSFESDKFLKDDSNTIKMMFAGTLNSKFRNPYPLLSYLDGYAKHFNKKIIVNFFGTIDKKNLLKIDSSNIIVVNHGTIKKEELVEKYAENEVLINIGNKNLSKSVPSKIFELFSTLKPIINYVFDSNDNTKKYFDNYPLAFTLENNKELSYNEFNNFINNYSNINLDSKTISEIYFKNTPRYLADEYIKKFNRWNNDKNQ